MSGNTFWKTAGKFHVTPLFHSSSTNGTYVNGNRLGKGMVTELRDQDEISLGERFSTKSVPRLGSFLGKCLRCSDMAHHCIRLGI
jgi:pSer/pThr/pTyr-binding forkhead associated (FHA) protein